MMGIDPVQAFNLLLERLDKLIAQLERIADEIERANDLEKEK